MQNHVRIQPTTTTHPCGIYRVLGVGLVLLNGVVIAGCDEVVTGPTPQIATPSQGNPLPVDPGIICQEQHPEEGTPLVLTGSKFSPVPFDIPDDPKVALPEIRFTRSWELNGDAGGGESIVYGGEPNGPNADRLTWQSQTQMTAYIPNAVELDGGQSGAFPVGVYDVTVTNANTENATSIGAVAVTSRPIVENVSPGIVCLEQGERQITLTGQTVLRIGDARAVVLIGDTRFDVDALEDCTAIRHEGLDAEYCSTARVTLPTDAVGVGYPSVRIENPATSSCTSLHEEDNIQLRVVPPPTLTAAIPAMVCDEEGIRDVLLQGTDILEIDGTLPTVTVAGEEVTVQSVGGCEDLETQGNTVRRCTEATIEIPQNTERSDVEIPEITLTNPGPAGCNGSNSTSLVLVPAPEINEVQPPLVCADDADQSVEVLGAGFLFVDNTPPQVTLAGDAISPDRITQGDGCEDLPVEGLAVRRCSSIVVSAPQGSLTQGDIPVSVTNPDPAGCSASATGVLTAVDGPEIERVDPFLVCTEDGARTLIVRGSGFLDVGGVWPEVAADDTELQVTNIEDCEEIAVNGLTVRQCATLTVQAEQGSLVEGEPALRVTNPAPAACTTSNSEVLDIPPALTLTSAAPNNICQTTAGNVDLVVEGTGFLRINGEDFTVAVDGAEIVPSSIDGCTELNTAEGTVSSCTSFTLALDASVYPLGNVSISVTNPDPSGCAETSTEIFAITPPPTLVSVAPEILCEGVVETLVLTGTDFVEGSSVFIGEQAADSVDWISDTELQATFNGGIAPGTYDVRVESAAGCEDTLAAAIVVEPTPLVFFVDPPVVYNGINLEVTVFATGLLRNAASVDLINEQGERTPLTNLQSPDRPNRILGTIEASEPALAPGNYEVSVTSDVGCESNLRGTVQITDQLTLSLESIEPSFVSSSQNTAVTITASDPDNGFEAVPRVYLNPTVSVGRSEATALRAVVVEDATKLSAVIPRGQVTGTYDLIVVNPSGSVGILPEAVTVVPKEPPFVSAVAPASINASTGQTATVFGRAFDTNPDGMSAVFECRDFLTGTDLGTTDAVINTASPTELNITVDGGAIGAGAVCVLVITNVDGSLYRFSAVSFKNPSQNLNPWSAGSPMLEARRAHSLAAGRPTDASRFLYAIGGDDGTPSGAKTSVESAPVDPFGEMGVWSQQRNDLSRVWDGSAFTSMPRTAASVSVIDKFVYLLGGDDGTGGLNSVLRAQILDPLNGPEIVDIDAELGDDTRGLDEGLWLYRISAVFPTTDPSNPGGESLPGEVLNVDLPQVEGGIVLTLRWDPIDGAEGYRIYRVPAAGDSINDVRLVAEIDGGDTTQWVDEGQATNPDETPFPQGSLGVWHTISTAPLSVARESHTTAQVRNPLNNRQTFLYAFGGRNADTVHGTGEYIMVETAPDGSQTLTTWQPITATFTARAELNGFVANSLQTPAIAQGTSFIYLGPGYDTNTVGETDAGLVEDNGDILSFTATDSPRPVRVGGGGFTANGFLFIVGGANRSPSGTGVSAEIVDPAPTLDNWNSLGGGSITTSRIYMGTAQESAFIFVSGGTTDLSPADNTVETTVQ